MLRDLTTKVASTAFRFSEMWVDEYRLAALSTINSFHACMPLPRRTMIAER